MAALIRDRYEPLEVVGRGGQGEVVRALDHMHDRQVALKLRRAGKAEDRAALLAEARVLLGLRAHPQLPVVREDFFVDDLYCVVMDWVDGTTLAERADRAGGRLRLPEVLSHLAQVAMALDHLHSHEPPVVHGDVKPANILLTGAGAAVLVDFGVARRGVAGGALAGTRGFAAPELALGTPLSPAADVFSLAATAFALLVGEPPRPGLRPPWRAIAGERAAQLEFAMRRGLALDPTRRQTTAAALVREMGAEAGRRTNLPMEPTSFVGRERLMVEMLSALGDDRLLTLVGPGGIGKSRLARQAAADVLDEVADGAYLVELAPLADPALVPAQILAALDVAPDPAADPTDALLAHLGPRRLLLVLDNCEHLREAVAALAARLLDACPRLRVLATSRQALGLAGERTLAVPPLDVPAADVEPSLEELACSEAARLVVERAVQARPDFSVAPADAAALAMLCRRLEGIPLALELAAARVTTLSLAELVRGLDDRFRVLRAGARPAPERHHTLRAAVEWSYDALVPPERRVFDRLSVFAGGFEPAAAEAVAGGAWIDAGDVAPLLATLADKSLLVPEETSRGLRYRMLETLRAFGAERLRSSGDEARVRARHLVWAQSLVADAGAHAHRADARPWLDRLDTELDNLREAMRWGLGHDPEGAMRVLVRMGWFWASRNRQTEGRRWWDEMLSANPDAPLELRANGLMQVANLADHQGDSTEARRKFEQALEAYRKLGDDPGVAKVLSSLGYNAAGRGDVVAARSLLDEAIALLEPLGPSAELALALGRRATLVAPRDPAAAKAAYEEVIAMYAAVGHEFGRAQFVLNLGLLHLDQGDLDDAEVLLGDALGPDRQGLQFGMMRSFALSGLARVALERADVTRARSLYEEVLADATKARFPTVAGLASQGLAKIALRQGDVVAARALLEQALVATPAPEASCLEDLAAVAVAEGRHEQAAELLSRASALRDSREEPLPPLDRSAVARTVTSTRFALGEAGFTAAWQRGRAQGD